MDLGAVTRHDGVVIRGPACVSLWCLALALLGACGGDELSTSLRREVRAGAAKGFTGAVLVMRGEQVLLDEAYGSERGVEMRTTSRFWIASGGKQLVSAAVLLCQERGWLALDDPVSRFFPGAPAPMASVTVDDLLHHRSGLPQGYVSEGVASRDEAVARILAEPAAGDRAFRYSNDNYQLAVAIVEVASGRPYAEFVETELLAPAGLHDTGFSGSAGARQVMPARGETPERLAHASWGGQGVYSSTHDFAAWYRALRGGRVLTPASTERLFRPDAPMVEGRVALGWFVGRTPGGATRIFTRGNEDFGANALIYAYPDRDIVIVILTHAGNANADESWSRYLHARLEALLIP
jgi:CubicO group peptidase (beta-lactamase class C family)